jgi:hypothetical protein
MDAIRLVAGLRTYKYEWLRSDVLAALADFPRVSDVVDAFIAADRDGSEPA